MGAACLWATSGFVTETGVLESWRGGVSSDYRRRGIASRLMRMQHSWCQQDGIARSDRDQCKQHRHAKTQSAVWFSGISSIYQPARPTKDRVDVDGERPYNGFLAIKGSQCGDVGNDGFFAWDIANVNTIA